MAFSVDFEVKGQVQGVWFRACTQEHAKSLGVVGWCMNTPEGSAKGVAQSKEKDALEKMKVTNI